MSDGIPEHGKLHVNMKTCSRCRVKKSKECFCKSRNEKDGLHRYCKTCCKKIRDGNKESAAAYNKAYRELNKAKLSEKHKAYKHIHKEEIAAKKKAEYQANKIEISIKKKLHYKENKLMVLARNKAYQLSNPEKLRSIHLRRKYGMTLDDYNTMLSEQGGICAICGSDKPKGKGAFHVDHDHKTGKVRALLCHHCNMILGQAKDSQRILIAAIAYLKKHNASNN